MYDVIVVGARCAGAPTAMLLARRGYRVLLADRATFPSDTLSTHFIKPPGVAMLRRWRLLDQVIASGCPPVPRFRFDYGPVVWLAHPRRWTVAPSVTPAPDDSGQHPGRGRRAGRRGGASRLHRGRGAD